MRGFTVLLHNCSRDLVTVEAAELHEGRWSGSPPLRGDSIPPNGDACWVGHGVGVGGGVEGCLHFAAASGRFAIAFARPWIGSADCRSDRMNAGLTCDPYLDESDPAFPVGLAVVGVPMAVLP